MYKSSSQYIYLYIKFYIIYFIKQTKIIEFATIKVLFDEVTARADTIIGMGSSYANVGYGNLFERSNDGKIIETYL
jgi:hypothetical protein